MRASSVLPNPTRPGQSDGGRDVPPKAIRNRPGWTVGGRRIIDDLMLGELVLLTMLYNLAARGAEADGQFDLMHEIAGDAAVLEFFIAQRAELAAAEVAGNA